jgi:hypothetical protein
MATFAFQTLNFVFARYPGACLLTRQFRNRGMRRLLEAQLDIFPALRTRHGASDVFSFKLKGLSAMKA